VANTNDGLAAARARGQRLGRPPVMTPEKIAYALALLAEPDRSLRSIAALLKISPTTLLKFRHFLDRFAVGSSRAGRYLRSLIITAFVALKFE
jgi:hypothetical protein